MPNSIEKAKTLFPSTPLPLEEMLSSLSGEKRPLREESSLDALIKSSGYNDFFQKTDSALISSTVGSMTTKELSASEKTPVVAHKKKVQKPLDLSYLSPISTLNHKLESIPEDSASKAPTSTPMRA